MMSELNKLCDVIMTSPESYFTECDKHCRAKATMPTSNLIIGKIQTKSHDDGHLKNLEQ